jgi:predicted RecA/RadA family phage recombinase
LTAIAAGVKGSLRLDGVWRVLKDDTTPFSVGDLVYWDDTNNEATGRVTLYVLGTCVEAAAAGADTVEVLRTAAEIIAT